MSHDGLRASFELSAHQAPGLRYKVEATAAGQPRGRSAGLQTATGEPSRPNDLRKPGGGGTAVTQQHPIESNHPHAGPPGLTPRRALRLAVMAGAGALAAACGEPEIPKIQPPVLPSTQRTQAAATQRTESAATPLPTVAVDLGERVPRPGTPPPPPPPSFSQTTPARPSDVRQQGLDLLAKRRSSRWRIYIPTRRPASCFCLATLPGARAGLAPAPSGGPLHMRRPHSAIHPLEPPQTAFMAHSPGTL